MAAPSPAPDEERRRCPFPYTSSGVLLSVAGLAAGARLTDDGRDIHAARHAPQTLTLKVRGGPSGNVTSVTFDGSRADLLNLLARMRLALDAVPPLAAERSPGGEAA